MTPEKSEVAGPQKHAKRYRRAEASKYLKMVWGLDYAPRTLAKIACVGGLGPKMEYAGRFPLYSEAALDDFARAKISPAVSNTSERQAQRLAA